MSKRAPSPKEPSQASADEPEALIATRRSLLTRLKRWDDDESWSDFFDTYWKLIYTVAVRAGLNDTDAQDVVQDTLMAVARQMPNFSYDPGLGSFKNWLLVITRRRILDHFRKQYRRLKTEPQPSNTTRRTEKLERIPDPAASLTNELWEQEWQHQRFEKALLRIKRQVEPRHFQIFDSHVLKEWPVKEVIKTFGITANQVYLIKHRVSALLAKELRKLESAL